MAFNVSGYSNSSVWSKAEFHSDNVLLTICRCLLSNAAHNNGSKAFSCDLRPSSLVAMMPVIFSHSDLTCNWLTMICRKTIGSYLLSQPRR